MGRVKDNMEADLVTHTCVLCAEEAETGLDRARPYLEEENTKTTTKDNFTFIK